jgi:hydrophobic/amphiphilic exporter-1 (mainly G- bacteria), HAE1 family
VLEFAWDTNMDIASMDVREKLDLLSLPREAEKPVILRFDPAYDPIMRVQLTGEQSLSRLRWVADKELKKILESTDGVAAVKVVGGREEQIRIEINEKKLAELGIPITEVTNVIQQANLNRASGSLYDLDANYLVRTLNEFQTVEEIQRIIVRDEQGRQVVLGDVAKVWRGTKDREIIARLDGEESVELGIYKEGDANTVTVSQAVRAKLKASRTTRAFPRPSNIGSFSTKPSSSSNRWTTCFRRRCWGACWRRSSSSSSCATCEAPSSSASPSRFRSWRPSR